jgi:hypothetical protein
VTIILFFLGENEESKEREMRKNKSNSIDGREDEAARA